MVLVASNVTAACAVICFTLVQRAQDIWLDPLNLTTYRTGPRAHIPNTAVFVAKCVRLQAITIFHGMALCPYFHCCYGCAGRCMCCCLFSSVPTASMTLRGEP